MTISLGAGGKSDNSGNSWCGGNISIPNIGYKKLIVTSGSISFNGSSYTAGAIINIDSVSTISVSINGFKAYGSSGSVTSSSVSAVFTLT